MIADYKRNGRSWKGEHSEVFEAGRDSDGALVVVKVSQPTDPDSDDLLANEAMSLRTIRTSGKHEQFLPYVPEIMTTFTEDDQRVNVFASIDGLVSLTEVMAAYPDGIVVADAAWMWRRLLVALGFVHANSFLHGAVTPDHVLIQPDEHGVVLVDWGYATPFGSPLTARSPRYRHWYPDPGIALHPRLDVLMACRTMAAVLGAGVDLAWPDFPERPLGGEESTMGPMWAHLRGCLLPDAGGAWELKEDFDALLERLYGPRKFRPFTMPT